MPGGETLVSRTDTFTTFPHSRKAGLFRDDLSYHLDRASSRGDWVECMDGLLGGRVQRCDFLDSKSLEAHLRSIGHPVEQETEGACPSAPEIHLGNVYS